MDDPYHGADGFGDTDHDGEPDLSHVQQEHAVNALVRLVKENPSNELFSLALINSNHFIKYFQSNLH